MSEVIAVFDIEVGEFFNRHSTDVTLTQAKIIDQNFLQQILELVGQKFEISKLPSLNIFGTHDIAYNFRYFTDLVEIKFLKNYYLLSDTHYTNLSNLEFEIFDDLRTHILMLQLIAEYKELLKILTKDEIKKYYLSKFEIDHNGDLKIIGGFGRIIEYQELLDVKEYIQKIYQILSLKKLRLSDQKSDYPELHKIIESYILENGNRVEIDTQDFWVVYQNWRPQIDNYVDLDSTEIVYPNKTVYQKIQKMFKKYKVDRLYYKKYSRK